LQNSNNTLQDYLTETSLITDIDIKNLTENRLTMMTVHSAKGLEYDNVYIVGMENDLFPLASAKEEEDIEEETRLFYVGITRAKKELSLSYCNSRYKYGNVSYSSPSFFLRKINADLLIDSVGNTFLNDYKKQSYSDISVSNGINSFIKTNKLSPFPIYNKANTFQPKKSYPVFDDMQYEDDYSQLPTNDTPYKVGELVKHKQFGTGKIVAITGFGDSLKLTVFFGNVGKKQLIAKYANLEKV